MHYPGSGVNKPLTKAEITRAMGWKSRGYLSKPEFKDMPDFFDIEDFKAWYNARSKRVTGMVRTEGPSKMTTREKSSSSIYVNIGRFADIPDEEWAGEMIRRLKRASSLTSGLVEQAALNQDAQMVAVHLRNWSDSLERCMKLVSKITDQQERRGKLVDGDKMLGLVFESLSSALRKMKDLGTLSAREANPGDPVRAKNAVDKKVDEVLTEITSGMRQLRKKRARTEESA